MKKTITDLSTITTGTEGLVHITDKIDYGTVFDNNYNASKTNPTYFKVGSPYTQGNVLRSLFDINNNGVLLYVPTTLDKSNITTEYESIFNLYPNLTNYPYLTPEYTNDISTITANSKEFPIFRYPGKGFGCSEFYNASNSISGLPCPYGGETTLNSYYFSNIFNGRLDVTNGASNTGLKYPYSGKLYSGNLVQLNIEENQDDSQFGNVKVILYQNGRGIPNDNPDSPYFSGNQYGNAYYPTIPNLKIMPELSTGCIPGNNNACLGITLNTETPGTRPGLEGAPIKPKGLNGRTLGTRDQIYKYNNHPADLDTSTFYWEDWFYHPSPFTSPSVNISFTRTPRVLSPENSNQNYYAPWPKWYAYTGSNNNLNFKNGDPVPVLSQGTVTTTIGAASNIGAQVYFEPDVEEGDNPIDNPNYVSVSVVPLFQGEKVKIGSEVYANCLGHVITPEPIGVSPYPPASYDDASGGIQGSVSSTFEDVFAGVQRDGRRENPWYDWFDPTYGATGWTGTPQYLLSGIPDEGTAIIETRNGSSLDYLNQSNQGTSIIQAISTTSGASVGGSGRMDLIAPTGRRKVGINQKLDNRLTKFPGTVENALCIGNSLEEITGTGMWAYTGTILDFDQTPDITGARYTTGLYDTRVANGDGTGATIDITAVNSDGSITTATLNSNGSEYTNGDILTLMTPSGSGSLPFPWAKGTISYYQNCGSVVLDTVTPGITLNPFGSNYVSQHFVPGYNISANNLIIEATTTINTGIGNSFALISFITSVSVFDVLDVTRYPVGTYVALMNDDHPSNWAVVEVLTNDGATITIDIVKNGGRNVYEIGTFLYSTIIVSFSPNPPNIFQEAPQGTLVGGTIGTFPNVEMSITASGVNGTINEIKLIKIPENNRTDDIILVNQKGSDLNCVFLLKNEVSNIVSPSAKLVTGGAGYWYHSLFYSDALTQRTSYDNFTSNLSNVNNPGSVFSGANVLIGPVKVGGVVNNISFLHNTPTYTGSPGQIQTVEQTFPISLANQPVSGGGTQNEPSTGWVSYVTRNTATFRQSVRVFISNAGSGYTVGGPFDITGGSGTDGTIFITKVDELGQITCVKFDNVGTGYQFGDVVGISTIGTGAELTLRIPISRELDLYFQESERLTPILHFNPVIIDGGTGYTVGGPFTTDCPVYDENTNPANKRGFNINVNILQVDADGAITELEIIIPPPSNNDAYFSYQLDYNIIVESGDENSLIKLSKPIKASPIEFTNGGSSYPIGTTNNISTLNLSQNNLVTLCGLETTGAGECEVLDYTASDLKPYFWDLTRYTVGDVIAFNQDGNISATAEILTINLATQEITFNQLTVGTGYVQPASSMYGFLSTVNLSQTATLVDITVNPDGEVTSISPQTFPSGTNYNDFLVIEAGDNNCVFQIASERDVPPIWQQSENGREATATEWNDFKAIMKSSVNLLDYRLVINFHKFYPNFYNNSWYFYGDPDNKDPYSAGICNHRVI